MRSVKAHRPGAGRSRAMTVGQDGVRGLAASAAMTDLDHRAGTQSDKLDGRLLNLETHRKALRHPHPIHRFFDIRERAWKLHALVVQHTGADALDMGLHRAPAINHRIDRRAFPDADITEYSLAEIAHGKPFIRGDEREERLRWRHHLA